MFGKKCGQDFDFVISSFRIIKLKIGQFGAILRVLNLFEFDVFNHFFQFSFFVKIAIF